MGKKLIARIASLVLFLHGIVEVLALLMLIIPAESLPVGFGEQSAFWGLLSAIYGLSRVVAGIAIWSLRKWGIGLGLALSLTTMVVASSIIPFGVVDLFLAIIVMVCLLYVWFGSAQA